MEISPNYEKALVVLALTEIAQGRPEEAVKLYAQLTPLSSLGASLAATGLADLAVHEGRLEEATDILKKGIAADIENKSHYRAADKSLILAQASSGPKPQQGAHRLCSDNSQNCPAHSSRFKNPPSYPPYQKSD